MAQTDSDKLGALIQRERSALLARWRREVRELPSAKRLTVPALNDHIPVLLDELARALEYPTARSIADVVSDGEAPAHGLQRVHDEFEIDEVVAEYNILRGCIHDLADRHGVMLRGPLFRLVNGVLDGAIGAALKAYSSQRALEVRNRREEYLAFVAHDLRTPLSAIAVVAQVLERQLPASNPPSHTNQMVKTLRRNVQRLEDLAAKILAQHSHCEPETELKQKRRQIDLWPLVEALIEDLQPLASATQTRLINQVPHDVVIFADASVLRRVFQNLVHNAIRYSPGREVQIGARHLPDRMCVECWVRDEGAGIPASLLERIFDKGQTDPLSNDGTGLGLTIVKSFTEAAGGTVSVESREGVGSTFRFTMPADSNA